MRKLFTPATYRVYSSSTSSWDDAARRLRPTWVRIQYSDHVWLGGYLGATGFINATPEPRELFLEEAWQLSETGEFERAIDGSLGVWVNCASAIAVEYIGAVSDNETSKEDHDDGGRPAERDGGGLDQRREQGGKAQQGEERLSARCHTDTKAQTSPRWWCWKPGFRQQ